jgi:radical SAM protein with 4Fe4S-binding SPASM domain
MNKEGNTPRLLKFPERVTLELTNHCNINCRICPRQYTNYNLGFMDSSLFMNIVDEMSEYGIKTLVPFFRGESLLHRDFINLIDYAKSKGMTIQLATNGTLMTKEFARAIVKLKLDFISFSVDSINPEDYAHMRRGSDFTRLIEGIENLLEERLSQKCEVPEVQISAVDTGMGNNVKQEFVSFWIDRVQHVRIYPRHTIDGRFGSLQHEHSNLARRLPCHKPFTEMVVYWDGRAAVCNHDWNSTEELGNVAVNGLKGVWNSNGYRNLRDRHLMNSFNKNEVCTNCDHWAQYYAENSLVGELYTGSNNITKEETANC